MIATSLAYLRSRPPQASRKDSKATSLQSQSSPGTTTPKCTASQNASHPSDRSEPQQLYDDPSAIDQGKGGNELPSRRAFEVHDRTELTDDDDDEDDLDSLEQSQLGEHSNVPLITQHRGLDIDEAKGKKSNLGSQLTGGIEVIRKAVSGAGDLRRWCCGVQYEMLLPAQLGLHSGPGWRKLEGNEYESVALEYEHRESDVHGK